MNALYPKTATRNDKSLRKVTRAHIGLLSAIALATPVRISPSRWKFFYRNDSSESSTRVIAFAHSSKYSAMVLVP